MKGVTYKIIGADGREYGPASLDEVREWTVDGRVGPATLVWESTDQAWLAAARRPELRWDLPADVAPPVLAAPAAPAAPGPDPLAVAPIPLRVAAYLFDALVVMTLVWLVSFPWRTEIVAAATAAEATMKQAVPDLAVVGRMYAWFFAFQIPVSLAYHAGFNAAWAGTPGKRLLGLRVVREDGSRLGLFRAVLRFAVEWGCILSGGIGFLVALFNPRCQAVHDLVASTRVVRAPAPNWAA